MRYISYSQEQNQTHSAESSRRLGRHGLLRACAPKRNVPARSPSTSTLCVWWTGRTHVCIFAVTVSLLDKSPARTCPPARPKAGWPTAFRRASSGLIRPRTVTAQQHVPLPHRRKGTYPLITPTGIIFATFFAIPALCTTSTT